MREKILVIHQGALGDLILSFPALLSLKSQNKASVSLLCKEELGKMACRLGVADTYFSLESAKLATLFAGQMTPFVKGLINDFTTLVLLSFSDDIERHIRCNCSGNVFRISPRPPVDEETHVALNLVGEFKKKGLIENHSKEPLFRDLPARKVCRREKAPYLVHPGAGSPRKLWPLENFIDLACRIESMDPGKVFFILGPADLEMAPRLKATGLPVYDHCSLSQLILLLNEAKIFIGHDSGVAHLAAFLGVPTIAVFGPSSPRRWAPLGHQVRTLRGKAECTPCFEVEKVNCDDPRCLLDVSVPMVLQAMETRSVI
jgi:heptosyltransferase-3